MPGIAAEQRDWEKVREGLAAWLATRWERAENVRVGPLAVNETNGFSSESVFVDVTYDEDGAPRDAALVARLPPLGGGLFRDYDLETQWRVQSVAGEHGIPVATQIGYEGDDSWVGSPFVMMERVPGRVPTDNPLYCITGWLHEESPTGQRTVCESAIETLADIHRLDWEQLGLASVAHGGVAGLGGELQWWDDYLLWASDGTPAPALAEAAAWCHANRPDPEPPSVLLWGDARLGNLIYGDDLRPSAVLDWEMTSIAPAEVDLGWFVATRTQTRVLAGGLPDPELPGFLDRGETIAHYERRLGRPIQDLRWYEVFAMVRWGTCIAAVQRLLRQLGFTDHFILDSPLLSDWVVELMDGPIDA